MTDPTVRLRLAFPHEMNRTLNLQYLSQCYLSPFSHAWPAKPSYLLSSKVSASSTISGSFVPTVLRRAAPFVTPGFYTMPSRPPNSPFISTNHSLPYLISLRDTYHHTGCSSPSFLRRHDSRLSTDPRNQQYSARGLPFSPTPAWATHSLLSVLSCPPLPSPWAVAHIAPQ